MKRCSILLIMLFCLIVFPSCRTMRISETSEVINEAVSSGTETPPDYSEAPISNYLDAVAHIYSDEELMNISLFKGTIAELNNKYPIECELDWKCRQGIDASEYPGFLYKGAKSYVLVRYENGIASEDCNGYLIATIYTLDEYLENVKEGMLLSEIRQFDPYGDYTMLDINWAAQAPGDRDNLKRRSLHRTSDGYYVFIYYDKDKICTDIECCLVKDYDTVIYGAELEKRLAELVRSD